MPRPRFSLRTLLVVVTAVCVWLGWQASIVYQRKAMKAEIEARGGRCYGAGESFGLENYFVGNPEKPYHGAFVRRWMGDEEYFVELPPDADSELMKRARYAFPNELIQVKPQ